MLTTTQSVINVALETIGKAVISKKTVKTTVLLLSREYIVKYTVHESPGREIWTNPSTERFGNYSAFKRLTGSVYEIYFYPERLREAIKKGVIKL